MVAMAGPSPPPGLSDLQQNRDDKEFSSNADPLALDEVCEDDRCNAPNAPIWHCVDCDSNYCSECWGYQGPHKAGKYGRDGVPHEKTDVKVVCRLKRILQPPSSPKAVQKCHDADQCTKWFGVSRDITGRPTLDDYGRYATLIGSLQPIESAKNRFPQLVSFIGVTNAGKSTIIKVLVNHTQEGELAFRNFPTPVVGSVTNDKVPTSGDVHLYADQSTHSSQLPILYADCEGFEGGERIPLGARPKKRPTSEAHVVQPEFAQARSLPIAWANNDESRRREFAVQELYPRLLYTFSDVVVFVLRNPKTFQSAVLSKLLDWGAAALEKSLNQPSLPHAIVLLNDTEPGIDDREWETEYATRSLLSSVNGALDYIEGVPRFRDLAQHWRNLGKQILTVEDLILRYYSSFKVVRMPRKPRYMLMDRQIARLHSEIRANCDASCKAKRKARMLTNADELNVYLQSAFEHFTKTLATPFNFVAVSLLNNPINYDFGGHMLQLINTIAAQETSYSTCSGHSSWIFERMCTMVASCIMLDCARYRKGRVEDLFDSYKKFFDWTLREYCDLWLPCAYSSGSGRRCMLVKARHNAKGHQDEEGIIAHGDYQSTFTSEAFGPVWERQLQSAIIAIQRAFQNEQDAAVSQDDAVTDEKVARRLHRQYTNDFFQEVGTANRIFSHATCFCCLMDVPEHPLPCGHVICSACVHTYGKTSSKCIIEMAYCPMHMDETRWPKPHLIKFKHKGAGTRVLCLDGGGIRGIVELEVLRAIEQALGGEIRVQDFFDLIVGTSTGGIIALALGVQQWPVDQCIEMFTSLCDHAYTPRIKGLPLLDLAATISHGSKYKTKAFHETLKEAFGDRNYLFGGRTQGATQTQTKVAVTSTSSTGGRAIVIANYRRKEDGEPEYDFERPHEPELEMRVWEAAAATSAAPTYFKPFVNPLTRRTYLDGALQNNNPARLANRERKLIWPEAAEVDPDIFLSLGTGQNRISILPKLSSKTTDWRTLQSTLQTAPAEKPKGMSRLLKSWSVLYNRVDDILNAEMAWAAFRQDVVGIDRAQRNSRRYIRFNPDLDRCAPSVDAKDELRSLQATVKKRLALPHCRTAVQHVAYRLIASSFYLDVSKRLLQVDGSCTFVCSILCKFEDGTNNLRGLGRFLQNAATKDFRPHFLVKGDARDTDGQVYELSSSLIDSMTKEATFALPAINVNVHNEKITSTVTLVLASYDGLEPDGFPISGMPKLLANECNEQRIVRRPTKSSLPSSRPINAFACSISRSGTVSLNGKPGKRLNWTPTAGPLAGLKPTERLDTAAELAGETHFKPYSTDPEVSYSNMKRPNRFWAYIGPAHMSQNRHLYAPEVLQKFAPAALHEPAELDGGDETEVRRIAYAELDNAEQQLKRTSIHHEVHAESRLVVPQRPRKDSARELDDTRPLSNVILSDQRIELPALPCIPPPFPEKKRGFDPGELEAAIQAAFG